MLLNWERAGTRVDPNVEAKDNSAYADHKALNSKVDFLKLRKTVRSRFHMHFPLIVPRKKSVDVGAAVCRGVNKVLPCPTHYVGGSPHIHVLCIH